MYGWVFGARLNDGVHEKLIDLNVETRMCSFIGKKGGGEELHCISIRS